VIVPIFEVRDVTYSITTVTALDGLNLTIMRAKSCLLGATGPASLPAQYSDGLCFGKESVAFQGEPLTEGAWRRR